MVWLHWCSSTMSKALSFILSTTKKRQQKQTNKYHLKPNKNYRTKTASIPSTETIYPKGMKKVCK